MDNEDPRAFGLRLKAFRAKRRLSQADIAEIIFSGKGKNVRVVGNIETGTRPIGEDELKRLNAKYIDFADFKIDTEDQQEVAELPLRNKFAREQREFLKARPRSYEMWFINGDALPMLRSAEIRKAWGSNIRDGINYSVLWDISILCQTPATSDRFRKLISISTKIAEEAGENTEKDSTKERKSAKSGATYNESTLSGVDIYGYYFGDIVRDDIDRLGRELYSEFANDDELKANMRLRIHPPFDALSLPRECWRLLVDSFFVNATTVVYLPLSQIAPAYVVLEPLETLDHFAGLDPKELHMFIGDKAAAEIAALVRAFKEWFHKGSSARESSLLPR